MFEFVDMKTINMPALNTLSDACNSYPGRIIVCIMMFFSASLCLMQSANASAENSARTGYPVANFGIGAEVSPSGRLIGRVTYNPPMYGKWLEDAAEGYFSFGDGKVNVRDEDFSEKQILRAWPFAKATFSGPELSGTSIAFSAFAPVARGDAFDTSLPAVLVEFDITNSSATEKTITVAYNCAAACAGLVPRAKKFLWAAPAGLSGGISLASQPPAEKKSAAGAASLVWNVIVPGHGSAKIRIAFLRFHENGFYAGRLPSESKLASYVFNKWDTLLESTRKFESALPASGNSTLDEALRWYMTAGVMLTKLLRDGNALTMGYSELNQRDSYWTSFIHLVYWTELDGKMIGESAAAQRADGKIPTTILPVIERDVDIDINCYFVLRVFRAAAYTRNMELLRGMWPNVKSAIKFLAGMDADGDGLPEQKNFWADWKDVPGIEGRKYGPHFTLLWLAVLKHAARWAEAVGDAAAMDEYKAMYEKAFETLNKPLSSGGLWNGSYYANVWNDGRTDGHVAEDQVVGILFGVADKDRAESIYRSLAPNETEWGVRETFPYRPDSFGMRGGDYHNGAIWPYLNFVDALSRIRSGRRDDGVRILEEVARADLFLHGDYLPSENIDGNTGENTHMWMQGWDASFFAAVYFGLAHSDAEIF